MGQVPTENYALQWRFWLITALVFAGFVWLFSGMLTPFVLGFAIAYFLDPLVKKMGQIGVPRWTSSLVVLLSFLALMIGLSIILVPIIRAQITDLINALPGYVDTLQKETWPRVKELLGYVPSVDTEKLQSSFSTYGGDAVSLVGKMLGRLVSSSFAILDILALFLITPIVAFYMLRDWPGILQQVDAILPQHLAPAIHRELHKIDTMIAGFVRGQALVSICLALLYSIGLSLVGLKYGMVIGLASGLLSFIPIVGSVTGLVTGLVMAYIQFNDIGSVLTVLGVFVAVFTFDSNFMTPKLVGDRVGLHPVWIMFAILAGGKLFGFLGVLLAVPTAGTLAILLSLALRQYRRSRYFNAAEDGALPPPPSSPPKA